MRKSEIKPSKAMQDYYNRNGDKISIDLILSSVLDKLAGYHISYSATELLKDLKFLTPNGKPNKEAIDFAATVSHWRYHANLEAYVVAKETK